VLNALVGDFFVINLVVDVMQPGVLIGRYVAARASRPSGWCAPVPPSCSGLMSPPLPPPRRYVVAPAALTQAEANAAYATPADIYLAFRLQVLLPLPCRCFCPSLYYVGVYASPLAFRRQLVGKFVVLSCIFGAAMPALYLLTAAFLTLAPQHGQSGVLVAPRPATTPHQTHQFRHF